MEPRSTQYPVYIPDQFLTNENLNETTGYVEMEERATRSYILGNGVIKGLNITNVTMSGTNVMSIQLRPGYGITPDGYLLETTNALANKPAAVTLGFATDEGSFKYISSASRKIFINNDENLSEFMNGNNPKPGVTVTPVQCVEIFSAAPDQQVDKRIIQTNIQAAINKIQNFNFNNSVLAFLADIDDVKYDNCSQGDCNDKGTDRIIKGRFVIIPLTVFQNIVSNSSLTTISYLQLPRLSKISAVPNPETFIANVGAAFNACRTAIVNKLTAISTNAQTILPKADMDAAISRLNGFAIGSQTHFASYYLGFVHDMQQAINEYLSVYNDYVVKYPTLNADRVDRLIILAHLATNVPATDPYRYYYRAVSQADTNKYHFEKLQRYFRRIIALVNRFYDVAATLLTKIGANTNAVKIIPSAEAHMPLGEKAIPYYYNLDGVNNEVLRHWRAHAADNHVDHINNYYTAPQVPHAQQDIAGYNFFRIEGHLGLAKTDALNKVSALITQHDLPVKVIAVNLKKPTTPPIKDLYDNFRDKYKAFTDKLVAANISYKSTTPVVNSIWQDMNQYSYKDTSGMQKLLNDVSSVMKPVESYTNATTEQEKQAIASKWVFSKYTTTQQQKIVAEVQSTELLKARKDLELAIKNTPQQDVVTISDYPGLEYLGGVYKGGTFILLHDGTKVVGDCSLPYFAS